MTFARDPDIEADVVMLGEVDGGRVTATRSGYRPQHRVLPDYLTTGTHDYVDTTTAEPGRPVRTRITFISPEAYQHSLSVGQQIDIQEGHRVVGHAIITCIMNKLLEKTARPAASP